MIRRNSYIFLAVFILFAGIFSTSCNRDSKAKLNSKQMENLLTDLHVLEGSLRASGMGYGQEEMEKGAYYRALFDRYGISSEEFDSCLSWYTRHPKKFERIYANVITRLETLRDDVDKGKFHPVDSANAIDSINLWYLPKKYTFTKDSVRNKLFFEVENSDLLADDMYELSFLHRVAPSDSSLNQHVVMYVNYLNGYVDSIYSATKNDSTLRRYTLKFKAREALKIKSLSGYILGNDSSIGKMNAFVDSVKLMRKYNPFKQDSIRAAVMKLDSTVVDSVDTSPKDSITITGKDSIHALDDDLLPQKLEGFEKTKKMDKIKVQEDE
ncbi:MAG: DUF4296 domain-containing protein [Bacteroidales bacterium]|nr:DUF4296 domain-containing protein [Bacteroidales bacterium]